ncbi:hypothetical protein MMC30_000807 [Trapelia coarctata]|nr:hypothetical protein [Trapelia coarctata]
MAPAGLSSLPTELVLMVMLQLCIPRDVYSINRSSVAIHRTFLTHKRKILSTVIRRVISSEVLPDALAACDASRIAGLISHCNSLDWSTRTSIRENRKVEDSMIQQATDFLRNYRQRRQHQVDDLSSTLRLCRLWTITECFVTRYSEQAFKNMHHYLKRQKPRTSRDSLERLSPTGAVSKAEYSRLQRAIFRFEIYRKLFTCGVESNSSYTPIMDQREQSRLLQVLFRPWELGELACVHEYLIKEMEYSFDELEGIFVENLKKAANEDEEILKTLDPSDPVCACGTRYTESGMLEWYGFGMFQEDDKSALHDDQVKFMVACGLPFLRRYLRLGTKDRMSVTTSYSYSSYTPSLDEVLDGTIYLPNRNRVTAAAGPAAYADTTDNSSIIWSWARKSKSQVSYRYPNPEETALRGLGYIFWDRARLQAADILDRPRDELELVLNHRDWSEMLTVEERLEGVRLLRSALEQQTSTIRPAKILGDFEY